MSTAIILLDAAIITAALLSAWFWHLASQTRMRRVSRNEIFDAADFNRVVTAMNRVQILSARAAAATAAAAGLAGLRLLLDL